MEAKEETVKKKVIRVGLDTALGTGVIIANLHANKIIPEKFVGYALLATGLAGNFFGGKNDFVRTAANVTIAMGAVKVLNQLGQENGLPSAQGYKGMINKIVPTLGAIDENAVLGDPIDPRDLLGLDDVVDVDHTVLGEDPQMLAGLSMERIM